MCRVWLVSSHFPLYWPCLQNTLFNSTEHGLKKLECRFHQLLCFLMWKCRPIHHTQLQNEASGTLFHEDTVCILIVSVFAVVVMRLLARLSVYRQIHFSYTTIQTWEHLQWFSTQSSPIKVCTIISWRSTFYYCNSISSILEFLKTWFSFMKNGL